MSFRNYVEQHYERRSAIRGSRPRHCSNRVRFVDGSPLAYTSVGRNYSSPLPHLPPTPLLRPSNSDNASSLSSLSTESSLTESSDSNGPHSAHLVSPPSPCSSFRRSGPPNPSKLPRENYRAAQHLDPNYPRASPPKSCSVRLEGEHIGQFRVNQSCHCACVGCRTHHDPTWATRNRPLDAENSSSDPNNNTNPDTDPNTPVRGREQERVHDWTPANPAEQHTLPSLQPSLNDDPLDFSYVLINGSQFIPPQTQTPRLHDTSTRSGESMPQTPRNETTPPMRNSPSLGGWSPLPLEDILIHSNEEDEYLPIPPICQKNMVPPSFGDPVRRPLSHWERFSLDPNTWLYAYDQLHTLLPSKWMDAMILDRYLLMAWTECPQRYRARYMPLTFLRSQHPSPSEIALFRGISNLPADGTCPLEPVIGVIHGGSSLNVGSHYYAVVVLPETRQVHFLGRRIDKVREEEGLFNWQGWGGQQVLNTICKYHGWDPQGYRVYHSDWRQNGYDCGPITCQVVESIWRNGFVTNPYGFWTSHTNLPCPHKTRRKMLDQFHIFATVNLNRFAHLYDHQQRQFNNVCLKTIVATIRDFLIGPGNYGVGHLLNQLDEAIATCSLCQKHSYTQGGPSTTETKSKPEVESQEPKELIQATPKAKPQKQKKLIPATPEGSTPQPRPFAGRYPYTFENGPYGRTVAGPYPMPHYPLSRTMTWTDPHPYTITNGPYGRTTGGAPRGTWPAHWQATPTPHPQARPTPSPVYSQPPPQAHPRASNGQHEATPHPQARTTPSPAHNQPPLQTHPMFRHPPRAVITIPGDIQPSQVTIDGITFVPYTPGAPVQSDAPLGRAAAPPPVPTEHVPPPTVTPGPEPLHSSGGESYCCLRDRDTPERGTPGFGIVTDLPSAAAPVTFQLPGQPNNYYFCLPPLTFNVSPGGGRIKKKSKRSHPYRSLYGH
ncbi:hypothetical protein P691DRAFT_759593 [Macrolepiota fuliginosa MF-IS2]|uniref:Uncharacterized protein n=1 Tax=Macrolepiota fuliginosa MF-IS2 TaxID=1400762 RepID=A0A9P5XEF7_9AGAR|nr:hypothetical protein P691DRAFT_759593 [Macrolepiota fuliginosa MF-IS2]